MSELDVLALRLLDFAQQSVVEGLSAPSSMRAYFVEADYAVRILGKILLKEDEQRSAKLALIGLFEYSFEELAKGNVDVREHLERVIFAKPLFAPRGSTEQQ
jgi:hypothetical protein